MGSSQFQRDYIEYLEKCNTELLNQLNYLRESNENRILSKDLNKDYLMSTLEDVLNIFTVIPDEIDMFFDKITAAMAAFKNILLRKSEMVQLRDKISRALNSNINASAMPVDDSLVMKDQFPESRINKKAGTVRVSPMINGHIISTEPRIYLSRVPAVFTSARSETHQLSPIIEASPDISSDPSNLNCHILKEITIPLERINLSKMPYNYICEESPKTRFKGPKIWKKSLSSNKRQSDFQRKSIFSENNENLNKKLSFGESENTDPLEGPSWLHEENPEISSSSNPFIDYRRRKHRFATVFDKDEDCCVYIEKSPKTVLKPNCVEFLENNDTDFEKELCHVEGIVENCKEIKERLSDSSEDFIYTSLSSEGGDNDSPFEKGHRNSRREPPEEGNEGKGVRKIKKLKKRVSTLKNKKGKRVSKTPVYSDSSEDEGNENKSLQKSIKDRNSSRKPLKSLCARMSTELSFEKSPVKSEYLEAEIRRSQRSKDLMRKNTSIKEESEREVGCELSDCKDEQKILRKRPKSRSPSETKTHCKKSKSKSQSKSPAIIFQENTGRAKRKAAPTKLVEPRLITKLRRN